MRNLDSKILVRRFEDAPTRRPKYVADLSMTHRLITRDPHTVGESMRLGSLKAKYREEYGELRAERQGQQELLERHGRGLSWISIAVYRTSSP